jgi:hypothetical protein
LLAKARKLTDLPVRQATVASTEPADSTRPEPSDDEPARQTTAARAVQTHVKGARKSWHWDFY